jgi:type IV secretory pathway VirB3-like protein
MQNEEKEVKILGGFDILGLPLFIFILCVTSWSLITNNPLPHIIVVILLVLSFIGVIVDSRNVYSVFLKNRK